MLDLGQRASVWIATSFHQLPRVHKHANAWSTHCLPGLMSPARAQTMISGTGELRLTGWNLHTTCTRCVAKPPCTAGRVHEMPTRLQPTQTPTDDRVCTRHSWSWSCGRAHRVPTDRQSAGWQRGLASGHLKLMRTTRASSAPAAPCADDE